MGLFDLLKGKKNLPATETRRDNLIRNGRITDGTILEVETNERGEEVAFYYYQIQGVDFESSEILTAEQLESPLKYAPGAKVGIKFDPKNHGNSIII